MVYDKLYKFRDSFVNGMNFLFYFQTWYKRELKFIYYLEQDIKTQEKPKKTHCRNTSKI